jgi:hypothetical protein
VSETLKSRIKGSEEAIHLGSSNRDGLALANGLVNGSGAVANSAFGISVALNGYSPAQASDEELGVEFDDEFAVEFDDELADEFHDELAVEFDDELVLEFDDEPALSSMVSLRTGSTTSPRMRLRI